VVPVLDHPLPGFPEAALIALSPGIPAHLFNGWQAPERPKTWAPESTHTSPVRMAPRESQSTPLAPFFFFLFPPTAAGEVECWRPGFWQGAGFSAALGAPPSQVSGSRSVGTERGAVPSGGCLQSCPEPTETSRLRARSQAETPALPPAPSYPTPLHPARRCHSAAPALPSPALRLHFATQ
jgi:hypothetical protein